MHNSPNNPTLLRPFWIWAFLKDFQTACETSINLNMLILNPIPEKGGNWSHGFDVKNNLDKIFWVYNNQGVCDRLLARLNTRILFFRPFWPLAFLFFHIFVMTYPLGHMLVLAPCNPRKEVNENVKEENCNMSIYVFIIKWSITTGREHGGCASRLPCVIRY